MTTVYIYYKLPLLYCLKSCLFTSVCCVFLSFSVSFCVINEEWLRKPGLKMASHLDRSLDPNTSQMPHSSL